VSAENLPAPGKIVVLEPYYGGSHKAFVDGLARNLPFDFRLYTLPARKWKWRMRLAAPMFAEQLETAADIQDAAAFLCSPFVDVAVLRALLPVGLRHIPVYTYFHENQFAYPVQVDDERDFHFSLTNLTTALASDRLAFNSRYNLESLLDGYRQLSGKIYDMKLERVEQKIRDKARILHPPLDFGGIDAAGGNSGAHARGGPPVILWNHRWEHDKNPEEFFQALYALAEGGVSFSLVVAGQSFQRVPAVFAEARERLGKRVSHFGFLPDRAEYIRWLRRASVVVSTARHEFYGMAVIEAVRAGCRPLLPDRLSYPELFAAEFLYREGELETALCAALEKGGLTDEQACELTDRFSWDALKPQFRQWLEP